MYLKRRLWLPQVGAEMYTVSQPMILFRNSAPILSDPVPLKHCNKVYVYEVII